ncbi:MAG: hypothetical protein ACYCQI_02230 [Gammaproteobacteria bacterium]
MKITFKFTTIYKTNFFYSECSFNFDAIRALYHFKKNPSMATLGLLNNKAGNFINIQDPITKHQYKFTYTDNWGLAALDISKYDNFERLSKALNSFEAIKEFTLEKFSSLPANTANDNAEAMFQVEYALNLLSKAQGKLNNDQLIRVLLGCLITQKDRPTRTNPSFWSYRPIAYLFPSHQTIFVETIKPVIEFFKEVIGVTDEKELRIAFDKFRRGEKVIVSAEQKTEMKLPPIGTETELTTFKAGIQRIR